MDRNAIKINNDIYKTNKKVVMNDCLITKKIGSGSFGDVHLAKIIKTGEYIAAKIEKRSQMPKIINEYKIYTFLRDNGFRRGIPKIYNFIQTPKYNILFMQLLGANLEDLFNKYNRQFKISTVLHIGTNIISLLEKLHNAKYIHRDIKPNNFLIGKNENSNQIFITDLGLSKKYVDKNNNHMTLKGGRSLIGTARYASINMHMGIEPSRRDDLESLGYMLIYFAKGSLPWQGIKKQNGKTNIEVIGEIKMTTSLEKLCEILPNCFSEYIVYCRNLKFEQDPDYEYLKKLFIKCQTDNDNTYEWCE